MTTKKYVFDIECDGFNPTKIHCVGASTSSSKGVKSTACYQSMRKLFTQTDVALIAHNGIRFDIPIVERLLDIKVKAKVYDTLIISWYLYPKRVKHGLADWGEEFGVPKPVVEDWDNQPIEVYLNRVEEDVKINTLLWEKFYKELLKMYKTEEEVFRFLDYLSFKMDCAKEQEQVGWKLDVPRAQANFDKLTVEVEEKFKALQSVMPNILVYKLVSKPPKPFKKNGQPSIAGLDWASLLQEKGLPMDHTDPVKVLKETKAPNAGSHIQLKEWLFSLGWRPSTFKFKRDKKTNETREIPQLSNKAGDGVCDSIIRMFDTEPNLRVLAGLSIAKHRLGLFKGFLENVRPDGTLQARVKGLTNTLRFKHTEIVNLPAVDKPWGEEIRGCLIADDAIRLMGSDMTALEDRTKQHYMLPHDPDYVATMQQEGYCPHVDIALLAGFVTEAEKERHRLGNFLDNDDKKRIIGARKKAKPVNYGSVYGQQAKGLARETGMPLKQCSELVKIYWERNWSVEAIAKEQRVFKFNGGHWLYNPVSRFYYSLRHDKDRFSTLNQGTGVYCFDTWVKYMRFFGLQMCGQMHDEVISPTKVGEESKVERLVYKAMEKTNKELRLNVELGCDVQFGSSYKDIH